MVTAIDVVVIDPPPDYRGLDSPLRSEGDRQ